MASLYSHEPASDPTLQSMRRRTHADDTRALICTSRGSATAPQERQSRVIPTASKTMHPAGLRYDNTPAGSLHYVPKTSEGGKGSSPGTNSPDTSSLACTFARSFAQLRASGRKLGKVKM